MHVISGDLGLVHPKLNALKSDYFSVADKVLKTHTLPAHAASFVVKLYSIAYLTSLIHTFALLPLLLLIMSYSGSLSP